MSSHFCYYHSPLGTLVIVQEGEAISNLGREDRINAGSLGQLGESPLLRRAALQLDEYFAGSCRDFDLPLAERGTPFQLRVWAALRRIPYGETRTYRDIALAVGCAKGYRAVGLANNRNPLLLITPCHRVVGSDGSLTGFGLGLPAKRFLLELEQGRIVK